jgi:hypothetical protein
MYDSGRKGKGVKSRRQHIASHSRKPARPDMRTAPITGAIFVAPKRKLKDERASRSVRASSTSERTRTARACARCLDKTTALTEGGDWPLYDEQAAIGKCAGCADNQRFPASTSIRAIPRSALFFRLSLTGVSVGTTSKVGRTLPSRRWPPRVVPSDRPRTT